MAVLKMKTQRSEHFIDEVDQSVEAANNHEHFKQCVSLDVLKEQAKVLKMVAKLTHREVHVIRDIECGSNVAGLIKTDTRQIYIRQSVLSDLAAAMYVMEHEIAHDECENFDLNQVFEHKLEKEDKRDLATALKISESEVTQWDKVEGLTDWIVAKDDMAVHRGFSGYEKEVDYAERLDRLALKLTGSRISTTFRLESSDAVVAHIFDVLEALRSNEVDSGGTYEDPKPADLKLVA